MVNLLLALGLASCSSFAVAAGAISAASNATAAKCSFLPNTGFEKGKQLPGHRNDPATTEQACCDLCAAIPGCAGASFTSGQCYYKSKSELGPNQKGRPLKGAVGVIVGTPLPPAPPPPKCGSFKTAAACAAAKGEKCSWVNGKCAKVAPPPPPPPPPPTPLPPAPPIAPVPATPPSPSCAAGAKPVKVFVMMGQSNMLGEGKIGKLTAPTPDSLANAVAVEGKYPYLYNKANKSWTTSKVIRNVFVMGGGAQPNNTGLGKVQTNSWMNGGIGHSGSVGPELGIGGMLEAASPDVPTMLLKSCIGNRALGWDLLPPGSKGHTFNNVSYAGYHESPQHCPIGTRGTSACEPIAWYAGCQFDGDTVRASAALANLSTFFPSTPPTNCYEVAGFFWWQGDRDSRDMGLASVYEQNLVALINALRKQYNAPKAPFVTASLGQTTQGATDGGGLILDAMEAVANGTKYPAFKGNVAAVYTHPLEHTPGSSGGHYGHDAETYARVTSTLLSLSFSLSLSRARSLSLSQVSFSLKSVMTGIFSLLRADT